MKNGEIKPWMRALLILCGLALIVVLFVPMWRIDLDAPQYPEGLWLLIYPNKLAGNVDIINGLNHYIGMKTLHSEDFKEFLILPYIIGFFSLLFIITGVVARKKLMYILLFLFVTFGVLAMYDFWQWEYNYGHNLDPNAAIIVPGMSYQPPLIGFKQLLNFGAYSFPDIGGWIFIFVGAVLLTISIIVFKNSRKKKGSLVVSVVIGLMLMLSACSTNPQPIKVGVDNCHFCKMTISDVRFGAELITKKGKIYKFDDCRCIVDFMKTAEVATADIKDMYLTNYLGQNELLNVSTVLLMQSEDLKSPMAGNVAAFNNLDSMRIIMNKFNGAVVEWNELSKP